MVKAMDEIFRYVEQAENPESFKVIQIFIHTNFLFQFHDKLRWEWNALS